MKDLASEKAVVGCLINSGPDAYFEVADMLTSNTFTDPTSSAMYYVIAQLYEDNTTVMDHQTVLSKARSEGLEPLVTADDITHFARSACHKSNLSHMVAKIRNLHVARLINQQFDDRQKQLLQLSGEEGITEILSLAEIDYTELVNDHNETQNIGQIAREIIEEVAANPVDQIGISTGFPIMDSCIGGGLRPASVTLLGARMKQGKSVVGANVALNVSGLGIPVLYVDTEMRTKEQVFRTIARMSKVEIGKLETGQFTKKTHERMMVDKALDDIEKNPNFHHINVAGQSFEQQLAVITRWIRTNVEQGLDGNWGKFVIIYDYIKLTSERGISNNMAEHQALGFMATTLHNLSVRYDCAIFALAQLNRDGIDKDSTDVIAGSDRIAQLVTSVIFLKPKSREEIDLDGEENGNKKFVVVMSRYGGGMGDEDYINVAMDGKLSWVREINTRSELFNARNQEAGSTN